MTDDASNATTPIDPPAAPAKKAAKRAPAKRAAKKAAAAPEPVDTASAGDDAAPAETAAAKPAKRVAKKAAKRTPAESDAAEAPAETAGASDSPASDSPTSDSPSSDSPASAPDEAPTGDAPRTRKRASARPAVQSLFSGATGESAAAEPATGRGRARRGAATTEASSVSDEAAVQPEVGDDAATSTESAQPSRSRRRGRGSAAVPTFSAGGDETPGQDTGTDAVADEDGADDAPRGRRRAPSAPLAVLFQPPAEDAAAPAAPRARRGRNAEPVPVTESDADQELTDEEIAQGLEADAAAAAAAGESAAGESAAELADEDDESEGARRRRRRGRRGRGRTRGEGDDNGEGTGDDAETSETEDDAPAVADDTAASDDDESATGTRRRRRRRSRSGSAEGGTDDPPNTVVRVRQPRAERDRSIASSDDDEVRGIAGSTRMEAKRQRRREGREQGRRRPPILTEAEFLARRESIERVMVVRQTAERTQIAVLEDGILVEHYVTRADATSYVGNVYLGRVQNVLPSMEAAFIDISKGKNGVLYAGEVNYDASQFDGRPHRIESALKPGQSVLVQVTKDPIGHKGARLTSQVSLPGRYLVYVPEGTMTGISRKLPENERNRLKSILKKIVPEEAGVIVRTAAEGASEEELTRDIARLQAQWATIMEKAQKASGGPTLLYGEPDLVIRVVRDIFNEDFTKLVVSGQTEWEMVEQYVQTFAPELSDRVQQWAGPDDVFAAHRVDEQLMKGLDRKVWLPSGGSLVIDRTEAMVVVDVNTGKFVGKGGNLEETVTKNNLEAAEEIVRQLRLRDLGGIIVIDFIDMVLESNRELVLRRLIECLGRDRTKHQVAEVTSLGLVQMTRKRVGQGLLEAFSENCEECNGRGVKVSLDPNLPGAPGNGRGAKPEHKHDNKPPRPGPANGRPKPAADRSAVANGTTNVTVPAQGDPTSAEAVDTPSDGIADALSEGSGRRRRGRRGGSKNANGSGLVESGADNASDGADAVAAEGAVADLTPEAAETTAETGVQDAVENLTQDASQDSTPDGARSDSAAAAEPATEQATATPPPIMIADEALDIDGDGAASSKRPARRRRKAPAAAE